MSIENSTWNGTLLEDNPFGQSSDLDAAETDLEYQRQIMRYVYTLADIIRFILCTVSLACDVYLIVIISKFKSLKNRINYYFLQYAVLNLLYLVLSNIVLMILQIARFKFRSSDFCMVQNFDYLTMIMGEYVLTYVAFEWIVSNYYSGFYEKYPRVFKYGFLVPYVLAIPKYVCTLIMCVDNSWRIFGIMSSIEALPFLLCTVSMIVFTILKLKKQGGAESYKTEYAFSIPRLVLLFSLPSYLYWIFIKLCSAVDFGTLAIKFIVFFEYTTEYMFLSCPIVVVYSLSKSNKYFKMAYIKSFKRNAREYEEDNLDSDHAEEANGGANNVAFNKDTEVIRF